MKFVSFIFFKWKEKNIDNSCACNLCSHLCNVRSVKTTTQDQLACGSKSPQCLYVLMGRLKSELQPSISKQGRSAVPCYARTSTLWDGYLQDPLLQQQQPFIYCFPLQPITHEIKMSPPPIGLAAGLLHSTGGSRDKKGSSYGFVYPSLRITYWPALCAASLAP